MKLEWVSVLIVLAGNLVLIAVAWGDLRRHVIGDRELIDERHEENKATLAEISRDVKRINGTVREHTGDLKDHEREIDRLRNRRRDA